MKSKRGVSGVVTVVILIALVVAIVAIVWAVVNNLIREEISGAESCFNLLGKMSLDSRYTCYDIGTGEFRFSISVGDLDADEALIGISGDGRGISFKLSKEGSAVENIVMYPGGETNVSLPGKNSGFTYIFDAGAAGFSEINSIEIAPIINGNQCGKSDTLNEIEDCSVLIS